MAYFEGEIPVVSNNGGNNGFGGFGGEGFWAIVLLAIIFGGNGNGIFGNGGGGGRYGGDFNLATDFATLERKLDGVNSGICDGFYAMNTGMLNGFAGITQAVTTNGYETRNAISDLGYALKDCCCQTSRAIDGVNYNVATHFGQLNNTLCGLGRDIIENNNANYRALHDEIVANKLEAKNDRIAELQLQVNNLQLKASQEAQNAYLLSELKACPKPSYVVPNPNCCYNANVTFGNSCGSVL